MGYGYYFLTTPVSLPAKTVTIIVPKGASLRLITSTLVQEGLLTNGQIFSWWAQFTGADRKIRAGEYEFTGALSPLEILRRLLTGEGLRLIVTIPEGFTLKEIAAVLAEKGMGSQESFLCLNTDFQFLAKWGLPPQGMEGYLFPDTYYFSSTSTPEEVLDRMISRFYGIFSPDMYRKADTLSHSIHEVVTMASLIEKETGTPSERPLVSAVIHNRLKMAIPLQIDPTVIYGIKDFDGNLTRQHLLAPTPYNTYTFLGLPPGPIANPGLKSLLAALNPANEDYLYFVAKGDGSHQFSSDLASHNRAVQRYQKRRSS